MATTPDVDWEAVGYVTSSVYREATLERLAESPATPSMIADDQEIAIASVSHALSQLSERDLVELLVDEDRRKGRYYGTTERGDDIASQIEEAV